jgi:hypothetical protein
VTSFELPQPRLRHVYRLEADSSRRWIETADPLLVWMNNSVFIAVGGRRPTGVTYDVYRVD